MSTKTDAVFELLDRHPDPMPLVAIDTGRLQDLSTISDATFQSCRLLGETRAGWLLYAGFGAQSHSISQDLSSREGSYWHAIYHRMEPDDWNAKYWFRQVGAHPITEQLAAQARTAGWNPGRNWDHSRFVEFVSAARSGNNHRDRKLAETIQMIEWRLLFEYCVKDLTE